MRAKLWPHADAGELASEAAAFSDRADVPTLDAVFIAEQDGRALGFLELSLREFSDGCDSMPVPYVEGWYVEPTAREHGIGRALMCAAETWSTERGFTEIASDTEIENEASLRAHERCGFEEVERLVKLRKCL
jgi:aminoglycoside 6'-N-acetyltransferase I